MLNGLDLFSGIGGMSIALNQWIRPIAYCEIDPYCQGVLLTQMACGGLGLAPIWDDIKTLQWNRGHIDIIYGGFPCQDISVAGNGKGLEGERSGLFFEIVRLAKEIKPKYLFIENVPAITSRGGLRVVREVAEMGYDCRWCVISAASVGALHRRDRWFLLAHSNNNGASTSEERTSIRERPIQRKGTKIQKESIGTSERTSSISSDVAHTRCECQRGKEKPEWPSIHFAGCDRYWSVEPRMDRMANGVQFRTHKLKSLGNAVVPMQAKEAFQILMGISKETSLQMSK